MSDLDNPLSPAALDDINEAINKANLAEKAIKKAVTAGIDLSSQLAVVREKRDKLSKIKQVYFAGR